MNTVRIGAILPGRIDERIGPPALNRGLSSEEFALISGPEKRMRQPPESSDPGRVPVGQAEDNRYTCEWRRFVPGLFRRERSVFVVPSVPGTVRRRDVKLHQVNVLTDRVGRREYLEVVQIKFPGIRLVAENFTQSPELARKKSGSGFGGFWLVSSASCSSIVIRACRSCHL